MMFCVNSNGTKVTIDILHRNCPDSDDYWDGNWLNANIKVSLPGYQASFNGDIRTDEVRAFLEGCKKMDQTLSGSVKFSSMEEIIELNGEIDRTGQIEWSGKTTYPVGTGATLTFKFLSDQSFLETLISELELIMSQFPVKGKP